MKCPQCGFENEEGSKFCKNCNEPLVKFKIPNAIEIPYIKPVIENKKSDNLWKILLAILSLCILGYGLFYSKNTIDDLPWLIGYYFSNSFIVWLIFYVSFIRKRGAKIVGFSFLVIYISFMLSGYLSVAMLKIEAKKTITEIEMQADKIIESSSSSNGIPKSIQEEIQTSPKSKGIFGEVERFVKELMDHTVSFRNDCLLELNAIGWSKLLDPTRLKNDTTFVESRFMITKGKEIIEKYKTLNYSIFENAYIEIDNLEMEEDLKKAMKDGFKKEMEPAKITLDRNWILEEKCVSEYEKIINLLSSRKDAWIIENNQILFYDEKDLNNFNTIISNIQEIVKEQQLMQQQSIEQYKESLKLMRENL